MKIAVWQTSPVSGAAEALTRLKGALAAAAEAGAALLVTPEMYLSGYAIGPERVAAAAADPSAWAKAQALAAEHGITLCLGGPAPAAEVGGRPLNVVRLLGGEGAEGLTYAKTHLFGDLDRAQFSAGDGPIPPVPLAGHRIGLAICYDIEFPETARLLATAGATLLAVPTANMVPFDSVCTRLVPARAEENGIAIAYANYVGREGDLTYCGRSCIVGPDGEDLARADGVEETLLIAEVDPTMIEAARARTPYLADRRPALYGALAQ
ncbi:MAG: nitrilase-related carbon-nitrogen hydrolase [Pseudomonadota bacterium]